MARNQTAQPVPGASDERARSKHIGGLGALWPFMVPYRGLIVASVGASWVASYEAG